MIKKQDKRVFARKFNRFRIFFFLSVFFFFSGLLGEIFFFGSGSFLLGEKGGAFQEIFLSLLSAEAAIYLGTFLFGVTIYAPVFGFLASFARGAFSGFALSLAAGEFPSGQGILFFVIVLFYSIFSSWLYFSYSSFCTNVALRIHSDPKPKTNSREELFGGTLFYSSLFCNLINLRFLFTYLLFFFASLCLSGTLCAVFSFFRSLLKL